MTRSAPTPSLADARAPVAVVTGGSSGIGAATAVRLRNNGYRVVVLDRRPAAEANAEDVCVDLTDAEAARAALTEVGDRLGRIDALVLAAGVKERGTVGSLGLASWDRMFAINVRALFVCVDAALPFLRAAENPAIVTVASASSHAERGALGYAASKGAVLTFTRSLALDLLPDGVRVNAVLPGYTTTGMADPLPPATRRAKEAENVAARLGEPDDVARAICHLVSTDSLTVSGAVLDVGHVQGAFVTARPSHPPKGSSDGCPGS